MLEIDPEDKRRLYAALDQEETTLKEWFLRQLRSYLEDSVQPSLFSNQDEE